MARDFRIDDGPVVRRNGCTYGCSLTVRSLNYVSLQRASDFYLLRESISMVVENLEPYGFIRIHRSALQRFIFCALYVERFAF